ncbi:hypothetical protein TWF788_005792 [Orbilia oligospora]|uniref:GLEYA adhesin domain-containing protein n=1 Tax=Orbilia oligospora TaxID=2813651 RepID=A0A7C8PXB7_ORBOL|nr:hypothetical protein TWF788_005792 [Orbilia oligospora]
MVSLLLAATFLFAVASNSHPTATTTTLFSTFRRTKTALRSTCGSNLDVLPLCDNIQWGSFSSRTQNEASSQMINPSTSTPDTISSFSQSTIVSTSTVSSNTGAPTEFRLRALIPGFDDAYVNTTYNGPIIIDVNAENRLLQGDDLLNNPMPRVADNADFKLAPEGTIRAIGANQRLIVYRRQTSSVGTPNDYGDALILRGNTLADNDISRKWYFRGCTLNLQNPSTFQLYRVYLLRIERTRYAVKMGAVGAQVPSTFEAYDLCYEPAASSSTSTSSVKTTLSISSVISSSLSSHQPSSTSSDLSSDAPESSPSMISSTPSSSLPSSSSSMQSSSSSVSSVMLNAYDIITLETLYSFCSNLLHSTMTSTSLTVTSSSSAEVSTKTITSSELVVCTSSHIEYASTSYIPTETSVTDLRQKKASIARRQEPYTTPAPLTSFDDAEVRVGCSSAIEAPTTTVESTTTSVVVVPYPSTTDFSSTETSYLTELVSSTIQSVLTSTIAANGYYRMRNDSLGTFDNYYFWINAKNHQGTLPDTTPIANTTRETFWQAIWDGTSGGWRLRYDWWRLANGVNITDSFYLVYFTTIPNPQRIQFRWLGTTKNTATVGTGKMLQYTLFDINDGYATILPSLEGTRTTLWTCLDGGTAQRPPSFWYYASTGWTDFVSTAIDGPNSNGQYSTYTLHDCVVVPGFHILGW